MISNSIAYAFCEQYGEAQNAYLDVNHYNYSHKNQKGIHILIHILKGALTSNEHDYVV